jgi:MFS family permease
MSAATKTATRSDSRSRQVLGNSSFRKLWAIGGSSTAMRWLDTVAVGAFVLDLTGSPFQVALTFFFRMIPMFALGAYIGAVSDRVNRKLLLIIAFSTLSAVYILLAVAVAVDVIQVWHVYLGALLAGTVWATDFPVRRAMVGEVVERENLSAAMGLDLATSNFMRIPGPFLGGFLLDNIGMTAVYSAGATLFLIAAVVAFTLEYTPKTQVGPRISPLQNIVEGVRYIRRDSVIITVLFVTIVMNMFAFPYQSMVPVIAQRTLGVSNTLMGLLISAEGLGATLGSLLVASKANPAHYSRIYFYGSVLFLCMILSFSRIPWYGAAIPILFVAGFGMSGFGTMQSIMIISSTPAEMRGRVLGVLAVSIGTGPVAALMIGVIAEAAGAPMAVLIIALTGLTFLAITAFVNRGFLKLRDVRPAEEKLEDLRTKQRSAMAAQNDGHHDEHGDKNDSPDHKTGVDSRTSATVVHSSSSSSAGLPGSAIEIGTDSDTGSADTRSINK